ncbi:MAG: TolB family protein [bacterium]
MTEAPRSRGGRDIGIWVAVAIVILIIIGLLLWWWFARRPAPRAPAPEEIPVEKPTVPERDTTPPEVPKGLEAVALSRTIVRLSWSANAEEDLAGYRIRYESEGQAPTVVDVGNTTSRTMSLPSNVLYKFSISAYDASGNESDFSSPISLKLGPTIAYRGVDDLGEGDYDLYSIGGGGGKPMKLTDNSFGDGFSPAWSPDGRMVAYVGSEGGQRDIYILRLEDGRVFKVPNGGGDELHPSWSPDGKRLVYQGYDPIDKDNEIYAIEIADPESPGAIVNLAGNKLDDIEPTWSPDGMWVAYASGSKSSHDLFVTASDGKGDTTNMTRTPMVDDGYEPNWSPNGVWIAYRNARGKGGKSDLYLVELDKGSRLVNLTGSGIDDGYFPRWASDSKKIVYGGEGNLYVLNLKDLDWLGEPLPKPATIARDASPQAVWSPDGTEIAFRGEDGNLYVVRASEGAQPRRLTDTDYDDGYEPDWR